MNFILRDYKNNCIYELSEEDTFLKLALENEKRTNLKVFAVKVNNEIKELHKKPEEDGTIEFLDLTYADGFKIHLRGIYFILYIALKELNKPDKFSVHHSLGTGIYCELSSGIPTEEYIKEIENKMYEIIEKNIKFEKFSERKYKAIKMFTEDGQRDKALLFKFRVKSSVNYYKANGYFNYFYGYMPPSTGYMNNFKLLKVHEGFVILAANPKSPDKVPEYKHFNKLSSTFNEYKSWLKILEIKTVGELNQKISQVKESVKEIIQISEALQEKKYANIADEIVKNKNTKIILIAGPSSSGKTTSAKRISLQLKVHGIKPAQISLDDYFVPRERTPRDENGDYDFESIHALDLDLFNTNLKNLIEGKEVEIPKFDFVTGKPLWTGKKLKIEENQPIIIEGIHGLNEELTSSIPRELKFKIYVSALTQMNLDEVNRIPTTDTRMIRRIVRDFNFRGHGALATLKMWPSVRRGEDKNIFPFQEDADVMFNSHLAYELCILKLFAEPLLINIDNSVPEHSEAKRILKFLDYFLPITELEEIPKKSVIREFIGRSTFEY